MNDMSFTFSIPDAYIEEDIRSRAPSSISKTYKQMNGTGSVGPNPMWAKKAITIPANSVSSYLRSEIQAYFWIS